MLRIGRPGDAGAAQPVREWCLAPGSGRPSEIVDLTKELIMNRRTIITAAVGAVATASLALGVCGPAAATTSEGGHRGRPAPVAVPHTHGADYLQLAVQIINESSSNLVWAGDRKGHVPSYAGPSVLLPGQSTFFVFRQPVSQGGLIAEPSWQVGNTGRFIYPIFEVPLITPNAYVCSPNHVDSGASVRLSKCTIERGFEPAAQVWVKDR